MMLDGSCVQAMSKNIPGVGKFNAHDLLTYFQGACNLPTLALTSRIYRVDKDLKPKSLRAVPSSFRGVYCLLARHYLLSRLNAMHLNTSFSSDTLDG
jgi:hypothetical protein